MDRQESTLGTLSRNQLDALRRFADEARHANLMDLLRETHEHLDAARQAHKSDPLVNLALAKAIADVIRRLIDAWDVGHFRPSDLRLAGNPQYDAGYWLRGAFRYFCHIDDEEPDLASPLGFEDDAEVLNACLCLAGLETWCINPEDYDDA